MKRTDWTQVEPAVTLAERQVDPPLSAAKSRPSMPMVRTCTLATVPAAEALTVTLCDAEGVPTGRGPTMACAWAVAASMTRRRGRSRADWQALGALRAPWGDFNGLLFNSLNIRITRSLRTDGYFLINCSKDTFSVLGIVRQPDTAP